MISYFSQEPFEGTFHIKDADLQKMAKVLNDVNIKECPYFDLSDKYGNSARYYRENQWIPVSERLPEERDSIFAKLYGTEKWRNAMFRKTSNTVIITVEFKDGTRQTAPCHTIDGEWNQSMKGMGKVIAWQPLPDPWKEEKNESK